MNARESSAYIGMNVYELYRRTAAGEIRAVVWGKSARNLKWRKADLDAYVAALPLRNGPVRSKPGTRRPEPEPANS